MASHRKIEAERAAEKHRQRQVGHRVDILHGIAARRRGRKEVRQQKPCGKHQNPLGPFRARQRGGSGQTRQRQCVDGGQTRPLSPAAERLEQEGEQAGGRVGKAGLQVDGVGHIKRAALHHHFRGKAPCRELVPLGKHRLLYAEQHPDKRSTAQKQGEARRTQGVLPRFAHPGWAQAHKARHPYGGQCQQHQHHPGPQDARNAAEIQHNDRAAQHRQRQQGGGKTGFFAQYRASTAEQKQKRKGIEKMQHGSLLSWNR